MINRGFMLEIKDAFLPGTGCDGELGRGLTVRVAENRRRLFDTLTFGDPIERTRLELDEIARECAEGNWDGYDALPVRPETLEAASDFLDALPFGLPAPSPSAEPDGHATFEWFAAPRWVVSVSIGPERTLNYAALFGSSRHFGSIGFAGYLPKPIEDHIRRVAKA